MAQTETQTDMPLSMLSLVLKVKPGDLFFLEQGGEGKALTAQVLETWLMEMAEGHGGVVDFQKTGTNGLEDTYAFTMSDATQFTFTVKNGERGPQGIQGPTGAAASLVSNTIEYASSTSGSVPPTSGWSANVPSVPQGSFLWSRSEIQFNSGDPAYLYSVARMGIDGSGAVNSVNGETGAVQLSAEDIGAIPAAGFLDRIYPVGFIYLSTSETSPASLFGGTWERLKDRFLLAAGDAYAPGSAGGEANHTLTASELPEISGSAALRASVDGSEMIMESSGVLSKSNVETGKGYSDLAISSTDNHYQNINIAFGENAAHNNMPPYLAVYMWKRTA